MTITWKRTFAAGQGTLVRVEAIRGDILREDHGPEGKPPVFSAIRDLRAMREYLLWHAFRLVQADVLRPSTEEPRGKAGRGTEAGEESLEEADRRPAGVPTGATATLLGALCREYRYTAASGDKVFVVNGTYWVPDDGPGSREYTAMHERLRGLDAGAEAEAGDRASRSVRQGGAVLERQFMDAARDRGIPYKVQFEVRGQGRRLVRREEALKISTARVRASTFVVPKQYKPRR